MATEFNGDLSELGDISQRLINNAREALSVIEERLPFGDLTIKVKINPQRTVPVYGLSGYANDDHVLTLWVDPSNPALARSLERPLCRTLAHEVHHCMRQRTVGYGTCLEEALITEGLADHFSLEVFPGPAEPWDLAFQPSKFKKWFTAAKEDFGNKEYDHIRWFFGSADPATPNWTGYTLGFQIVEQYLEANIDDKPSTLFAKRASDIYMTLGLT